MMAVTHLSQVPAVHAGAVPLGLLQLVAGHEGHDGRLLAGGCAADHNRAAAGPHIRQQRLRLFDAQNVAEGGAIDDQLPWDRLPRQLYHLLICRVQSRERGLEGRLGAKRGLGKDPLKGFSGGVILCCGFGFACIHNANSIFRGTPPHPPNNQPHLSPAQTQIYAIFCKWYRQMVQIAVHGHSCAYCRLECRSCIYEGPSFRSHPFMMTTT